MSHIACAFITHYPVSRTSIRTAAASTRCIGHRQVPLSHRCATYRRFTHVPLSMTLSESRENTQLARPRSLDKGTLLLCMLCVSGYVLDHILHLPIMSSLYLHHSKFVPYQLMTSLFCHASFDHLSGNLFPLLIFGRFVEEEAGAAGVILAFLLCGACANIASIVLLGGSTVSLGASGAVFSLFTLAVMVRFRLRIGRLLEAFILSTHVASRMRNEFLQAARSSTAMGAVRINHVAHIAGALAGVLLVLLINLIVRHSEPPPLDGKPQLERESIR